MFQLSWEGNWLMQYTSVHILTVGMYFDTQLIFQNAIGAFNIWKCHLDRISSVSVSRFISNSSDVDLQTFRNYFIMRSFLDIRHQVWIHVPFPTSIPPQLCSPTKTREIRAGQIDKLHSSSLSLSLSLSFLICTLGKQRLTRKWNQSSVSSRPFLSFRQWLNFPVACTKPVPTGASA